MNRKPRSPALEPDLTAEDCNACDSLGAIKGALDSKLLSQVQKKNANSNTNTNQPPSSRENTDSNKHTEEKEKDNEFWSIEQPPDIVQLGNAGWTLLHTMAAYYPDRPSDQEKSNMRFFLDSFTKTFPCKYCANDFADIISDKPPNVESQKDLSLWMCQAHNEVNRHLGKPDFDCSLVDKRWKKEKKH
eukprot:TRINITY_DN7046_c0_g1_i2.p1 TRINITY_DN7046_c0_g1~~TRINITY_DN7046_c0_g1_i2.p1  ORF type:complete len:188 (+),score=36.25 TRINITY_DN7046_c0_g1_i2:2-565(+)